jgi:phosphatidylcholine synthase
VRKESCPWRSSSTISWARSYGDLRAGSAIDSAPVVPRSAAREDSGSGILRPGSERLRPRTGRGATTLTSPAARDRHPPQRLAFAWGVHVLTASGGVLGLAALLAAGAGNLRTAVWLLIVAFGIDAVDGTLARAARVSEVVPGIDGRRLDDIVDYLNYVVVPAVFLVAAGSLVHWGFAAAPVLASAFGFAQTEAKTEDHFFLGWPSYWNVVALYLWGLDVPPPVGTAVVLILAVAVFVPLKYLYPSRMGALRRTTAVAGGLWGAAVIASVLPPGAPWQRPLLAASLLFPLYYFAVSLWLGGLHRRAP